MWTDSTIILSWLIADQKLFKIFVTNPVAQIHTFLPTCEWSHVDTAENPADPASRGLLQASLASIVLFFHGPNFLYEPEDQWPLSTLSTVTPEHLPEIQRPLKYVLHTHTRDETILQRFSSLSRMYRVLAFSSRILDKLRKRTTVSGPITWQESEQINKRVIILTQHLYYSNLLKKLNDSHSNVTPTIGPFVDQQGIIRVGGRLKYATLPEDAKHLILLPKKSHLTKLIIWYY